MVDVFKRQLVVVGIVRYICRVVEAEELPKRNIAYELFVFCEVFE